MSVKFDENLSKQQTKFIVNKFVQQQNKKTRYKINKYSNKEIH